QHDSTGSRRVRGRDGAYLAHARACVRPRRPDSGGTRRSAHAVRAGAMNHGAAAEAIAASFLEAYGLLIVQRNYRCRGGEIDLIARDGATLVFFEVRLRRNRAFGNAAESITAAKRRRLRFAARHYLARL